MLTPRSGRIFLSTALAFTSVGLFVGPASAKTALKAKLTPKQAEAIALKAHAKGKLSGKPNLESEDGKVQYEVLIREGKKLLEVNVDANSGKINSTETTSAAEEAREKAEKSKGKKGEKAEGKESEEDEDRK